MTWVPKRRKQPLKQRIAKAERELVQWVILHDIARAKAAFATAEESDSCFNTLIRDDVSTLP